jgi:hypothetical protein
MHVRDWILECKTVMFLDAFAKLRKATISVVMSVHLSYLSAWSNSASTRQILMKLDI